VCARACACARCSLALAAPFQSFARALSASPQLRALKLYFNRASTACAQPFADAVAAHARLELLDLRNNGLGVDGARRLLEGARRNRAGGGRLKQLLVSGFAEEGAAAVQSQINAVVDAPLPAAAAAAAAEEDSKRVDLEPPSPSGSPSMPPSPAPSTPVSGGRGLRGSERESCF
jgi:hypothetical protein